MIEEIKIMHNKREIVIKLSLNLKTEQELKKRIDYKRCGLDKWLLD